MTNRQRLTQRMERRKVMLEVSIQVEREKLHRPTFAEELLALPEAERDAEIGRLWRAYQESK